MGIFSKKEKAPEKKPAELIALDVPRIERQLGQPIADDEKKQFQDFWLLADEQIRETARAYRALGVEEGKAAIISKFVELGKQALENYRAEYARHAASGDLKGAMRFEERRKILADISADIMEV